MKNLTVIFLLFTTVIFCQPGRFNRGSDFVKNTVLKPTIQVFPGVDSEISLSYLYRVPYNRLIFERNSESFVSSIRILVEIYDENELITREFIENKITVEDFEAVKSKSASVQGMIHFNLSNKTYTIKGTISDLNSDIEIPFHTIEFDGEDYLNNGIYSPIIIDPSDSGCNGELLPLIVNRGGALPFSSKNYSLVIPLADTTIKSIQVKIKDNDKEVITRTIEEFITGKIDVKECDERIFITIDSNGSHTNNFILSDINLMLNEGRYIINVIADGYDDAIEFPLAVVWQNKPYSLGNYEFAINILKNIEDDSVILHMLDFDEEEYPKLLQEYWKQFDPTPDTEFNELMEEFYSRVDYAAMEYRGIGKKNGISSDRAKIYIKNGKPDDIKRSSNELGYVVEIWTYKNLKSVFQFVDKKGTGNFVLIEG